MSFWEQHDESLEQTATIGGVELLAKWKHNLSFREEADLISRVTDEKTQRPDLLELLAILVDEHIDDVMERNDGEWVSLGLTGRRVRTDLAKRPKLAWPLITWLCQPLLEGMSPKRVEVVEKKSGRP